MRQQPTTVARHIPVKLTNMEEDELQQAMSVYGSVGRRRYYQLIRLRSAPDLLCLVTNGHMKISTAYHELKEREEAVAWVLAARCARRRFLYRRRKAA